MKGAEHELQSAGIEYCQWRGAVTIRINAGLTVLTDGAGKKRAIRGAATGTSDTINMYKGRGLAIEYKTGRNVPTEAQTDFLQRWQAAGGESACCWSLEDVQAALDEIDAGQPVTLHLVPPARRKAA